jgi:hypothetical protein
MGVRLGREDCDAFGADPNNEYPQITRAGNHVRLVAFSVHYDDLSQCIFAADSFVLPIGEFGAGQYVVQIDRVYPNIGGGLTTEALGELTLVVGGDIATPTQLPVDHPLALGLLLVVLLVLSTRVLGGRPR